MYAIEMTEYGFKLIFQDFIDAAEMKRWVDESNMYLKNISGSFSVFIDMRYLKPIPLDSQKLMQEGQALYKNKGMERSAVILNSIILAKQFKRLAKESGIYDWERYIDASSTVDWDQAALKWLKSGIDPDTSQ